jgi:hypothetical protein
MNEILNGEDSSLELPGDSLETSGTVIHSLPERPDRFDGRDSRHIKLKYVIVAVILLIVLALLGAGLLLLRNTSSNKKTTTTVTINTQSLDNGTLNRLTTKGAPDQTKQQLTISPDTLFINNVEVQAALTVDKSLSVGDDLLVKGKTTLQGAVGIDNNLAVHGALSVTGSLTAAGLSVGSLTAISLNLSGDLNFSGHIIPSGAEPRVQAGVAAAGGTVRVSGNDTAGTLTITTGTSASLSGNLAIITFHAKFPAIPKVQLTPINSKASALNYYATHSVFFFTVDSSSVLEPNTEYIYDYLVTQ